MRNDYHNQTQNPAFNRLVLQEEFILEVTEALSRALAESGMTQSKLAQKLGCTRGFVSQVFAGGRNLTLRTVSDIAMALGVRPSFSVDALTMQGDCNLGTIDVSQYAKRPPKIVLHASAFTQPEAERDLAVA
jgi:transcriptional regulator with XRE-family HTH domain